MRDKPHRNNPCDCEDEGVRNPTTQPISPSEPDQTNQDPPAPSRRRPGRGGQRLGGPGPGTGGRGPAAADRVGEGRGRGVCLPDVPRRRGVGRRRRRGSAAAARRGSGGGAGGRRHHVCGSLWQEVLLHLRRRAPPAVPSLPSLLPPASGQAVPPLPLAPRRLRRTPTGGARPPSTCALPRHGSPGLPPPLPHFILPSPSHFPDLLVGPFLVVSRRGFVVSLSVNL